MYIEFALSNDRAGPDLLLIRYHLLKWSQRYEINYIEKTIKHTHNSSRKGTV